MMKTKLLLPSALLGILLIATPAMAQSTPPIADGVEFEEVTTGGSPNFWIVDQLETPGVETVVITTAGSPGSIAVLGGSDETWDNESNPFKHLNISGLSGTGAQLGGFRYQTSGGIAFDGGLFGGSITVNNSAGSAYGATFYKVDATPFAADISGIIDITGTINVTSTANDTTQGVTGFVAGNLLATSNVSIGSIKAKGGDGTGWATGVQILGTEVDSLLTVGSLDVDGPMAIGITMRDSAEGRVEVGQIDATSTWRTAGIFIGQADADGELNTSADANELVLKGNINVKGYGNASATELGGYAAVGVLVGGDAYIELDGDVNIKATATAVANNETAAIHTGGGLVLNLAGNTFSTENDINVGEGLYVYSGYENKSGDWVALDGTFKAGDVTVGGDADFWSVDNTTLNLEAENFTVTTGDLTLEAWDGGIINATVGTVNVTGDVALIASAHDNAPPDYTGGTIVASINSLAFTGNLLVDAERGGKIDLGVNFADAATAGNNFSGSELLGNVTLFVFGEQADDVVPDKASFATIDKDVKLVNLAIFTSYWLDIDKNELHFDRAKRANLNNEFLVASAMHNRLTGYNMVRDRFISAQRRSGNGYRGQAWCDPCEPVAANPCDPCGTFGGRGLARSTARTAWVNYVGRGDSYGDWDITSNGVQLGTDLIRTNRTQFGVIFGYEDGRAKRPNDVNDFTYGRVDSEDVYFGLYAARVLRNGADVRFVYNIGFQDFNMVRGFTNPFFVPQEFKSSFDGRTHEVNLELGKRYYDGAWSIRPYAALDIYSTYLSRAVEAPVSDGTAGTMPSLTYAKTTTTQIFVRPGVDIRLQGKRGSFNTGFSYAVDMRNEAHQTKVTNVTYGTLVARGTGLGGQLLNFNVGGDLQLGRNLTAFGGYDMQAVVDRSGGIMHTGHVGGAVRW